MKQGWPWNNRPSKRHVIKVLSQVGDEFREKCLRCGAHYNTRAGGTIAIYCFATREWLAIHPEDNAKYGRPPFDGGVE